MIFFITIITCSSNKNIFRKILIFVIVTGDAGHRFVSWSEGMRFGPASTAVTSDPAGNATISTTGPAITTSTLNPGNRLSSMVSPMVNGQHQYTQGGLRKKRQTASARPISRQFVPGSPTHGDSLPHDVDGNSFLERWGQMKWNIVGAIY